MIRRPHLLHTNRIKQPNLFDVLKALNYLQSFPYLVFKTTFKLRIILVIFVFQTYLLGSQLWNRWMEMYLSNVLTNFLLLLCSTFHKITLTEIGPNIDLFHQNESLLQKGLYLVGLFRFKWWIKNLYPQMSDARLMSYPINLQIVNKIINKFSKNV